MNELRFFQVRKCHDEFCCKVLDKLDIQRAFSPKQIIEGPVGNIFKEEVQSVWVLEGRVKLDYGGVFQIREDIFLCVDLVGFLFQVNQLFLNYLKGVVSRRV